MIEWTDEDYAMASDVYLKLGDMAAALDAALASALKREAQQRKEASDEQDRLMPLDPPTILDEPISQQYLREQVQKQMLPVREALAECEAAPQIPELDRAIQDAVTHGVGFLLVLSDGHTERVNPEHIMLKIAAAPKPGDDHE